MSRKELYSTTIVALFFVAMLNVAVPVVAAPATLHVGTGYPYAEIQDAIDNAVDGDTIIIHPGTYESIIVDKKLTIKGTNAIIHGSNPIGGFDVGVYINVSGVVFCGFTVETTGHDVVGINAEGDVPIDNVRIMNNKVYTDGESICYGVYVEGAGTCISNNKFKTEGYTYSFGIYVVGDNARISNNKIQAEASGESYGIYLYGSNNARITNNKIQTEGASNCGIYLYDSNDARITNNNVKANGDVQSYGIELWFVNNAYISGNKIDIDAHNSWGILIDGNYARIINNNVHTEGVDVSDGLWILGENAKISGNTFSCQVGIYVEYGPQSNIQRNTINAEAVGIWLYDSSQSQVETNTITGLTHTDYDDLTNAYGILVQGYDSNLIYDNTITGSNVANSIGIGLGSDSYDNTLLLNKIDNVDTKIIDEGTGNIRLANWR